MRPVDRCLQYFPESPRYDLASGHVAKATATLRRVAAQNKTSLPAGTLRPSTQASGVRRAGQWWGGGGGGGGVVDEVVNISELVTGSGLCLPFL